MPMSNHRDTSPLSKHDNALLEEQAFCCAALECDEFDTMSDKEWVEACEKVAARAREARESAGLAAQDGKQPD